MKIASYNVENLFLRAVALNQSSIAAGTPILEAHAKVNELLSRASYTAPVWAQIQKHLATLGLTKSDESAFAYLRQNRGKLLVHKKNGTLELVASGRGAWIGWVELKVEMVDEVATENTARVIDLVKPDVLAVIEAESRPALVRFSHDVLPKVGAKPFDHVMLIDGNDDRGIDVGLLTRGSHRIVEMRSHVDDADSDGPIFSRDCAEYDVETPSGVVTFLVNHFKSRIGAPAVSGKKRLRQATRVREIYDALRKKGQDRVVVLGDLNDDPSAPALAPLVGSDLRDIATHPSFQGDGLTGTWGNGVAKDKIDFIFLSPALWKTVKAGGIERRGVWGGKNGTIFPHLATIKTAGEAASDHAAIWAEVAV